MAPRTLKIEALCHISRKISDLVQVELPKLQAAISIACRLGFAKRLPNPYEGAHHCGNLGVYHAETACYGDVVESPPCMQP